MGKAVTDDLARVRAQESITVNDLADKLYGKLGVTPDDETTIRIEGSFLEVRKRVEQETALDISEFVGRLLARIGVSPDLVSSISLRPNRWLTIHTYQKDSKGSLCFDAETGVYAETVTEYFIDTAGSSEFYYLKEKGAES